MDQIPAADIKAGQTFKVAGNTWTATHDAEPVTLNTPHMGTRQLAAIRTDRTNAAFSGGYYSVEVLADTLVTVLD